MKETEMKPNEKKELSLYEQFLKSKPQFASNAEALKHFEIKLTEIIRRTGRTYEEMFKQYEYSSEVDEDAEEAVWIMNKINRFKRLVDA